MLSPKIVHQIWLGSELPEREKEWVTTVKEWCSKYRISYKLWDIEELRKTYPSEPIWAFADTLPDTVRKFVLLADYFRFIAINPGEMYLDTDFVCTRAPEIVFNNKYISTIGEYWNGSKATNGLICVGEHFNKLNELKNEIRKKAKRLTPESLNDLCAALGPDFLRKTCEKMGISIKIINRSEATHWQWKNKGALIHQGAGSWVEK